MRRLFFHAVGLTIAVAALPATAQAGLADAPTPRVLYQDGHTGRYLLDGRWVRRLDPDDAGVDEAWQEQVDEAGWSPVSVPDAWNATQLTDASQEGGVAWYRRDFDLPEAPAGSRWAIRFESVNYRATVWVNGRQVGAHTGAYLPFEVPGDALQPGGANRLVVRVDNRRLPADLPPFELSGAGRPGGGWWNDGGILREVYLRRLADVDVRWLDVRTRASGLVMVRAGLAGTTGGAVGARPSIRLGLRSVELPEIELPPGRTVPVSVEVEVERPRRWSPSRPYLYPLSISDGDTELYKLKIGIREWSVHGGRLRLNGKPIRLFGASMHEDEAGRGQAMTDVQRRADVRALDRLGATVTRAHYPLHPRTLELLDRRGIALWSQIPAYRYSDEALAEPAVRRQALDYLGDAVRRDRNHAAILPFSVANELSSRPRAGTRRYIADAAGRVRRLARGALAALDTSAYPTVGKKLIYENALDALGINEYFGWYLGPRNTTASRDTLGPYLDSARRSYPGLALFVTEFGAEANREGFPELKGTYAFQSEFIRHHFAEVARRPFINGALVWLLRDFRCRPGFTGGNPQPTAPFNQKGLLNYEGEAKPAYSVTKAAIRRAKQAS